MSDCKNNDCKDCKENYLQNMTPCPQAPGACAGTQNPCEDSTDSLCVAYNGDAVMCGSTSLLTQGMSVHDALKNIAQYFCTNGGGGGQAPDLTALQACCATNTTNITNLTTTVSNYQDKCIIHQRLSHYSSSIQWPICLVLAQHHIWCTFHS